MRAKRWMIALLALAVLLMALPAFAEDAAQGVPTEQTLDPEEVTAAPVDAPMSADGEVDLSSLLAEDEQEADLSQFIEPAEEVPEAPSADAAPGDAQATPADAAPQGYQAAPAGVEELPDGTLVCLPAEEYYVMDVGTDLTDEDLFAGYANRLFYGQQNVLMATMNAGEQLTGQNRTIYDAIKPEILKVADGSRASTEFGVPIVQLIGKTRASATELGVPLAYDANGKLTEACVNSLWAAFYGQFQFEVSRISTALWYDCTYEMYWFNRYQNGLGYQPPRVSLRYDSALGDYVVSAADDAAYMFRFSVLNEFASDTYAVDAAKAQAPRNAAAKAKAIVKQYTNCSDYAKLYAYVAEICRLASYNTPASRPGWDMSQQTPWKLIWVFDGDPNTTVVCEGYTQAFQYLCELSDFDSGVRCYTVDGFANESHAWNLVRMGDGKNYVVDVTWTDGSWADGLSSPIGGLAEAISGDSNARLFLVGGAGSAKGGYTIRYRAGSDAGYRTYSENTLAAYPEDMLTVAGDKYVPTGLMRIAGSTYYFDESGRYITGNKTIDGLVYSFGSDGRLTSVVGTGWQTIDGKKYFFDENGNLHTEHTVEPIAGKAATCTTEGYTEGKRCSVCKTVLEEPATIPALGHLWGEPSYTWAEDNSRATATRTCVHNQEHIQTVTVNTTSMVTRAATCEEKGQTTYTANFLSDSFTTRTRTVDNIPARGHSVTLDPGYPATCTENGLTDGSHCGVCNKVFSQQQVIPARGHSVTLIPGYPATCTADGLTDGSYCTVCSTVFQAQTPIPATDHTPVADPGYPAALHVEGRTDGSHCAVCGAVLVAQQPIPALEYEQIVLTRFKSNGTITLSKGDVRRIVPAFATDAGLTVTGYKSSKPAAVSIDGNGVLTCNAEGKAKITVTTNNRRKKATLTIKVVDPYKPTGIAIAQGKSVTLLVGQTLQLGVGLAPQSAQTTLTWTSNKPKVATVDPNGLVTPQGEGKAKITVRTHNKKKATITVRVVDPNKPLGVAIAQGKAVTMRVGETLQLSAALAPATARSALTWKANKPKIATVDGSGLVTAQKKGKAKITVTTYNKKKATITVNVVP